MATMVFPQFPWYPVSGSAGIQTDESENYLLFIIGRKRKKPFNSQMKDTDDFKAKRNQWDKR